MKRALIALLLVTTLSCVVKGGEELQEAVPLPKKLDAGLYDMTDRWEALFGMKGKLTIANARKDAMAAVADGPVRLGFEAQASEPGVYGFIFVRVDQGARVYEALIIAVTVFERPERVENTEQVTVNPDVIRNQAMMYVAPNEKFLVRWEYNPGGEGIPGGWRLLRTTFSDKVQPLPGFENVLGE